jgi:hypothetical protein
MHSFADDINYVSVWCFQVVTAYIRKRSSSVAATNCSVISASKSWLSWLRLVR